MELKKARSDLTTDQKPREGGKQTGDLRPQEKFGIDSALVKTPKIVCITIRQN